MSILSVGTGSYVIAGSYTGFAVTLNDDTAVSISGAVRGFRYQFVLFSTAAHAFVGGVRYSQTISTILNVGCSVVAGAGTLAGTTGPDGTVNVRENASILYVENRSGVTLTIGITYIGSDL